MRQHEPSLTKKIQERRAKKAAASSMPRLRVLPITMLMAMLLFSVKAVDVYQGGREIQLRLQGAYAEEEKPESKEKAEEGAGAESEVAEEEKPSKEDEELMKIADIKEANEKITGSNRQFSQIEVDLLQSLKERREEIEERARELDLKEKLLEATELRINDKIEEIKALEQKVSGLLEQYGKEEESHIRSLVKIYESMKPKSAAEIFNELEMPILLEVIDGMSERKVAPILSAMDPMKAKEVTADLAEMRKLSNPVLR